MLTYKCLAVEVLSGVVVAQLVLDHVQHEAVLLPGLEQQRAPLVEVALQSDVRKQPLTAVPLC